MGLTTYWGIYVLLLFSELSGIGIKRNCLIVESWNIMAGGERKGKKIGIPNKNRKILKQKMKIFSQIISIQIPLREHSFHQTG